MASIRDHARGKAGCSRQQPVIFTSSHDTHATRSIVCPQLSARSTTGELVVVIGLAGKAIRLTKP